MSRLCFQMDHLALPVGRSTASSRRMRSRLAISVCGIIVPHTHQRKDMSGTLDQPASVPTPIEEPKHRSGYARKAAAMRRLYAEHEALKADHQKLTRHYEALKAGHAELQAAFDELLSIHNGLLADLKQSRQVRTTASSLAGFGMMGQRHA